MQRKPACIASGAIVIAMLIMSAWAWTQLPDGARIPVHWNANGMPDRYADKIQALLQLPLVAGIIALLFGVLPRMMNDRVSQLSMGVFSEEAMTTIWIGVWMACMLAIGGNHAATILPAAGCAATTIVQVEIGLLFVILGGYHLGTVSRASLLGVRTPWTEVSDLSWNRSQQLAGQIFVGMGLATVGLALAGNAMLLLSAFLTCTGLFIATLMSYSYWLSKNDPHAQVAR